MSNDLIFSRLEERRETVRKPDVDLETELAEADNRRRMMEQQRIQKLSQLSGADRIERARREQVRSQERKQEDAMTQRKEQLETMRYIVKQGKNKNKSLSKRKKSLVNSLVTFVNLSELFIVSNRNHFLVTLEVPLISLITTFSSGQN